MIKAILFDLDGTLINTNELVIKSFQHTFKHHFNIDMSSAEIVKFFGEPLLETMKRYDKEDPERLIATFREFNESKHDSLAKSFNGVIETLKGLKEAGLYTAVVTSKRKVMAERGLNLFGLDKYIDVLVTPEVTKKHKPDGEPALMACNLLCVAPGETIMVGDSHFDILCGKNAGCKTCLVSYTALEQDEVKKFSPDFVVDSLTEILDIIDYAEDYEEYTHTLR